MKKALALITCVVMLLSLIYVDAYAQMKTASIAEDNQHVLSDENVQPSDTIFELITNYITYLDTHQYEKITNLLCDEEKAEFTAFIQNQDNRETFTGFFNYKNASLISIKKFEKDYQSLGFHYNDAKRISCWDCVIDVNTYSDTEYLTTGLNHFIFLVDETNSHEPKILGMVRDKNWLATSEDSTSGIDLYSYDAPVSPPSIGTWSTPSTIKVLYNGSTTSVNFKQYCYVVTTNEVGTDSYNQTARKAVALAIKNYGWNRTLVQKYSGYGYDVKSTTADQVYNPSKTVTTNVRNAVDSIWGYVMLSCDYKLFCGFHVASSSVNSYAKKNGGILSQTEAATLAQNGYSWQGILHYYYDNGTYNSEMKSGTIRIPALSHSATGSYSKGNDTYHWIVCTTCGCTHTRVKHTWNYNSSKSLYVCSVCGRTATSIPSTNGIRTGEVS